MAALQMGPSVDVRKLAAVDMRGALGTSRRRRIIRAEFILGVAGGVALGVWVLSSWGGVAGLLVGICLLGLAANDAALALHAITLSRSSALADELREVNVRAALRRYNTAQFWIFVRPFSRSLPSPSWATPHRVAAPDSVRRPFENDRHLGLLREILDGSPRKDRHGPN